MGGYRIGLLTLSDSLRRVARVSGPTTRFVHSPLRSQDLVQLRFQIMVLQLQSVVFFAYGGKRFCMSLEDFVLQTFEGKVWIVYIILVVPTVKLKELCDCVRLLLFFFILMF